MEERIKTLEEKVAQIEERIVSFQGRAIERERKHLGLLLKYTEARRWRFNKLDQDVASLSMVMGLVFKLLLDEEDIDTTKAASLLKKELAALVQNKSNSNLIAMVETLHQWCQDRAAGIRWPEIQ